MNRSRIKISRVYRWTKKKKKNRAATNRDLRSTLDINEFDVWHQLLRNRLSSPCQDSRCAISAKTGVATHRRRDVDRTRGGAARRVRFREALVNFSRRRSLKEAREVCHEKGGRKANERKREKTHEARTKDEFETDDLSRGREDTRERVRKEKERKRGEKREERI